MANDRDASDTVKNLSKLSKEELETTRKGVLLLRKLFNTSGVGVILIMLVWPGLFTIFFGAIAVWFAAYLASSGDFILKHVDANLEKLKKR